MRNKKGVLMSMYLVLLTLFMVSLVWVYYANHQDDLKGSLVSPASVLVSQDELQIFEMREVELMKSVASEVDWGAEGFGNEFHEKFVNGLDSKMKNFIFDDLYWKEQVLDDVSDKDSFLRNVLYSVSEDSGGLVVQRNTIGKSKTLFAEKTNNVNFAVDYVFDFSREYSVKKVNGEIVVEVLE